MNARKEISEAWDIALKFLYKSTPKMTAIAMLAVLMAGTLTYLIIGNGSTEEGNLPLASAMKQYGNWVVFIFDAEILTIVATVYAVTRIPAKRYSFWKAFHIFMIIFILATAMLSLGNDITLALGMDGVWNTAFAPAQVNPILRNILWSR